MSVAEMKLEAINQIGKLNDEKAMKELLEYLNILTSNSEVKISLLHHAFEIMKERSEVLEKLAK